MSNRPVALIGFMGAGKTTLGEYAACRLGLAFADADALAEEGTGMPVADMFSLLGEEGFRAREASVLADIALAGAGTLFACGGGVCEGAANIALLQSRFYTVFLDCPAEECIRRTAGSGRPLVKRLGPAGLADLYVRRLPLYRRAAHVVLPVGGTVEQDGDALVALLQSGR